MNKAVTFANTKPHHSASNSDCLSLAVLEVLTVLTKGLLLAVNEDYFIIIFTFKNVLVLSVGVDMIFIIFDYVTILTNLTKTCIVVKIVVWFRPFFLNILQLLYLNIFFHPLFSWIPCHMYSSNIFWNLLIRVKGYLTHTRFFKWFGIRCKYNFFFKKASFFKSIICLFTCCWGRTN